MEKTYGAINQYSMVLSLLGQASKHACLLKQTNWSTVAIQRHKKMFVIRLMQILLVPMQILLVCLKIQTVPQNANQRINTNHKLSHETLQKTFV